MSRRGGELAGRARRGDGRAVIPRPAHLSAQNHEALRATRAPPRVLACLRVSSTRKAVPSDSAAAVACAGQRQDRRIATEAPPSGVKRKGRGTIDQSSAGVSPGGELPLLRERVIAQRVHSPSAPCVRPAAGVRVSKGCEFATRETASHAASRLSRCPTSGVGGLLQRCPAMLGMCASLVGLEQFACFGGTLQAGSPAAPISQKTTLAQDRQRVGPTCPVTCWRSPCSRQPS